MGVHEEVEDVKVGVYKWNEKLSSINSSQGLFLFQIKIRSKEEAKSEYGCFTKLGKLKIDEQLAIFDLKYLSTRKSTENLITHAIDITKYQFSQETNTKLRKSVASYMLSCFRFVMQTPKPTVVIVVDAYVMKTTTSSSQRRIFLSAFSLKKNMLFDRRVLVKEGSSSSEVVVKKRKIEDDDSRGDDSRGESKRIRRKLISHLKEPMRLWCQPILSYEPQGFNEVEAAVKAKKYEGDHDQQPEDEDVCSICLERIFKEGMVIAKTRCCHMYHSDCLFKWLPKMGYCPMCRSSCATLV